MSEFEKDNLNEAAGFSGENPIEKPNEDSRSSL